MSANTYSAESFLAGSCSSNICFTKLMESDMEAEIARLERRSRLTFVMFIASWALACVAILLAMFRHTTF